METKKVSIKTLVEVPELKNFYCSQSNEDLKFFIEECGLKSPIIVSKDYSIIDGYRRLDSVISLGGTEIDVFVVNDPPTIAERIIRNLTRIKTTSDLVNEMRYVFQKYPKRQGKRSKDGSVYIRDEKISAALGGKWRGDTSISKLETILNNELEGDFLIRGIVENRWKMEPCYEFITQWKGVDQRKGYGYTKMMLEGEISVSEANQFIRQRESLDTFTDTFIIPDKVTSYNIDSVEIGKLKKYSGVVDLILSSVPYFQLRKYDSPIENQIGEQIQIDQYCKEISRVIKSVVPTLKESANVIINIGETYKEGKGLGIPDHLKSVIEKETGLIYKDRLVWSKSNPKPQGEDTKRLINSVEYLLWFVLDVTKAKHNILKYKVNKQPKILSGVKDVTSKGIIHKKRKVLKKPYKKIFSHIKEQEILNIIYSAAGANHDVYKVCKEGHPAIMSPVLPVVPILMCTDEGDTVYDPFAGTNVVGRMACLLNRKSLASEISKKYFDIGCRLLENSVAEFDRHSLDVITEFSFKRDSQNLSVSGTDFMKYNFSDGNVMYKDFNIARQGGEFELSKSQNKAVA